MKKIIMYSTKTWPHCIKGKEFLSKSGYHYEIKDVNEDPEANREFQQLGLQGVPAFKIGEEIVVGLDIQKIQSLLDYTVTPCESCNKRMRVPKGKGKLKVTCPNCGHKTIKNT